MSNIVEFVVKMKDMMSGSLSQLSSTSRSAFNTMSQQADRVSGRNRLLGQSYNELQKRIQEVENTIKTSTIPRQIAAAKRELASLQRMSSRHSGNTGNNQSPNGGASLGKLAVGNMIGGMAAQAGMAILGVMKDGIGAAIGGSMKKEQDIVGLSTFLGKDQANETYQNIRQDASVTPYGTESLLEVNRALISAGVSAKDAREDTLNLANSISAVGGGNAELSRMAANMQQIKTVGKATAMDIRQFGMVGINIYEMLARSTGKSIDEVKEMDVTYDQLAKSMAMARSKGGIYEGALDTQGKTSGAKFEQIKDKFGSALIDIGDAFSPIISKVLDVGIKIADSITPLLARAEPFITKISDGLGVAIDYITGLIEETGSWMDYVSIVSDYFGNVMSYVKTIFVQIGNIVGSILKWIGHSEIIKDIFRFIGWTLGHVIKPLVEWLGKALLWVWDNVLKPILDGLETAYKFIKNLGSIGDNAITIEVNKKTKEDDKPELHPSPQPYQSDLTRFKDKGLIGSTEDKNKKNKESSKKAGETISGGGPKTINITLGKFFDTIQFTTMNGQESSHELEKIVMECLGRVLYNGAKTI